jgi:hypothetical protein
MDDGLPMEMIESKSDLQDKFLLKRNGKLTRAKMAIQRTPRAEITHDVEVIVIHTHTTKTINNIKKWLVQCNI